MKLRNKVQNALDNPRSQAFYVVNDTLAVLTLLSVVCIVLETVSSLHEFKPVFTLIEYITVGAFTLEYLARILTSRRPIVYAISFFGVIDLLAIIPTYLGVANLTYLKSARVLRILRFLRILRLAKVGRTKHLKRVSPVMLNVAIYFGTLFSAVVIFGSLIYILEPQNPAFANIPLGMLWAGKSLLGGLGGSTEAQVPFTHGGQVLALLVRFTGLLLIGLLVSVVGNVMRYILTGTKK